MLRAVSCRAVPCHARGRYDVLVASDAIGMGLNLNIRRIVFSTLSKPVRRPSAAGGAAGADAGGGGGGGKGGAMGRATAWRGGAVEQLSASAIKQIAGRAGRRSR